MQSLLSPNVRRIAIGNPRQAPYWPRRRKRQLLALSAARVGCRVCVCIAQRTLYWGLDRLGEQRSNHLVGRIRLLDREGPVVRVGIDCGFPLKPLVTCQACEDMGLRDGREVTALFKAPDIRLIPRE